MTSAERSSSVSRSPCNLYQALAFLPLCEKRPGSQASIYSRVYLRLQLLLSPPPPSHKGNSRQHGGETSNGVGQLPDMQIYFPSTQYITGYCFIWRICHLPLLLKHACRVERVKYSLSKTTENQNCCTYPELVPVFNNHTKVHKQECLIMTVTYTLFFSWSSDTLLLASLSSVPTAST